LVIRGECSDFFVKVFFSFEEVVKRRLLILSASTAEILNDITSQKIELLIHNKIPNLDSSMLIVLRVGL
jgi:hypothetical protein